MTGEGKEEAMSGTVWTYALDHDFNDPPNEGGFHEVVLPRHMEHAIRRGMTVRLRDRDADLSVKGRVRCLVAVIEPESQP